MHSELAPDIIIPYKGSMCTPNPSPYFLRMPEQYKSCAIVHSVFMYARMQGHEEAEPML